MNELINEKMYERMNEGMSLMNDFQLKCLGYLAI